MFKIRVKCFSKNTGEIFYIYDTKIFHDSTLLREKLEVALSVFQKRLMSDISEHCTFQVDVLRVRDSLSLDFGISSDVKSSDVDDYNKNPVLF